MRWRQPVGVGLLALIAGLAGVIAGSFSSGLGPPPLLTDLLQSNRATAWIADAWIQASVPASPGQTPIARRGDLIPNLALVSLDGKPLDTSAWKGQRVVLNFWASWCAPCREEMPALNQFAQAQSGNGILVLGLAVDDRTSVQQFLAETPVSYPIVLAADASVDPPRQYGNARSALPYTILIDRDSRIVEQRLGPVDAARLDAWIAAHP